MGFEWQVYSKDFKMKVRKIVDDSVPIDAEAIDNYIKKNFLKLNMHIQRMSKTEEYKYIVHFILQKGTTMLFMDFFSDFCTLLNSKDLKILDSSPAVESICLKQWEILS